VNGLDWLPEGHLLITATRKLGRKNKTSTWNSRLMYSNVKIKQPVIAGRFPMVARFPMVFYLIDLDRIAILMSYKRSVRCRYKMMWRNVKESSSPTLRESSPALFPLAFLLTGSLLLLDRRSCAGHLWRSLSPFFCNLDATTVRRRWQEEKVNRSEKEQGSRKWERVDRRKRSSRVVAIWSGARANHL